MRLLVRLTLPACLVVAAVAGASRADLESTPPAAADAALHTNELVFDWPAVPLAGTFATLPLAGGVWSGTDPWPLDRTHDDPRWSASWSAFADDLVALAARRRAGGAVAPEEAADNAARHARLALAALHQVRHADAWQHLAELAAAAPREAGLLLPHFAPGAPLVHDATRLLPEGVVLRPALPPPAADGRPPFAPFTVEGVRIGASRITAQLEVRGDGIDLRYRLDEGPHVSFAAVLPSVPGLATLVEYYDWERADTVGEPLPVVLTEVGEWYRLWGRVRPARPGWPGRLPTTTPRHLENFGLVVLIDENDPERAYLEGFAGAAARLLPFDVRVARPSDPSMQAQEQAIDLSPDERRAAKLSDMTGLVARFALGEADAR